MPDIVILAVVDLARATAFYRAALDLAPVIETPVYVELTGGVGLYQRAGFAKNVGTTPVEAPRGGAITATELYFRVPDVDEACRRLERAGAPVLSAVSARPWGETVGYYADPDGNVIAVAGPVPP